jgi:hypothetical protein
MSIQKHLQESWRRFKQDETGAICVGCGLDVVDGVVEVQIVEGGGLACDPTTGLSVNFPAPSVLDPISPDACNGIARRGNGLYSPCPDAVLGAQDSASAQNSLLPLAITGTNNDYFFESDVVTITNGLCCEVTGRITVLAGGLYVTAGTGFRAYGRLLVDINGAGYAAAFPETNRYVNNNGTGDIVADFNGLQDQNLLILAAGASATYRAEIQIHVDIGSGTLDQIFSPVSPPGAGFEFNWELVQTGCC